MRNRGSQHGTVWVKATCVCCKRPDSADVILGAKNPMGHHQAVRCSDCRRKCPPHAVPRRERECLVRESPNA